MWNEVNFPIKICLTVALRFWISGFSSRQTGSNIVQLSFVLSSVKCKVYPVASKAAVPFFRCAILFRDYSSNFRLSTAGVSSAAPSKAPTTSPASAASRTKRGSNPSVGAANGSVAPAAPAAPAVDPMELAALKRQVEELTAQVSFFCWFASREMDFWKTRFTLAQLAPFEIQESTFTCFSIDC